MCAIADYLIEKHNQTVYRDDCLWVMAASKMDENRRDALIRPHDEVNRNRNKKQDTPAMTVEETLDFIFEGMND